MNKNNKVIRTLAEVAADYYRLIGAGEDSDRQVNILHTAAGVYQTATKQPAEVLEQAWETVNAEKIAAEKNLPLKDNRPLNALNNFEQICTELQQMAVVTSNAEAKQALISTAEYLHDYKEAAQ